jgi:hypothetical protein
MLLFSQGPTKHSRIGNSLIWMTCAFNDLAKHPSVSYAFPWAEEKFGEFLSSDSIWLKRIPNLDSTFLDLFSYSLDSTSLAKVSREIEAEYEKENSLQAHQWESLLISFEHRGARVLYGCGKEIDFTQFIERSHEHHLAILHEPFNILYRTPRFPMASIDHARPRPELLEIAYSYVSSHRTDPSNLKLGLHIRRGDYAEWNNGNYFYSDETWESLCKDKLSQGNDVFVFTNEGSDPLLDHLASLGAIISKGSYCEDLTRMACMDTVLGPPSTFPLIARQIARDCYGNTLTYKHIS